VEVKWALLLLVLLGCARAVKRHAAQQPTTRPRPTTKAAKEPEAHPVPGRWYFPRLTPLQNINAKAGCGMFYRGILVNVEMNSEGRFVPAIHDPLRHKEHAECALPECTADSVEKAERNAERWIDHSYAGDVLDVWRGAFGEAVAH
jgi:hypothetical protein